MKKNIKYLFLFSMLLAVTASVSAYSPLKFTTDPHDSLLFDGESIQNVKSQIIDTCMVLVNLRGVRGKVEGMVARDTIELLDCITMGKVRKCEWKQLKPADLLCGNDSIVTGPTGYVELLIGGNYEYPFGTEIIDSERFVIGPGSVVYPPKCLSNSAVLLKKGKLKIKESAESVKKKIIETYRSVIKPKGTEYSVETNDSTDIIRVYEGAVEVSFLKIDIDDDDMTKKLEKLGEEMQSGKITAEEMQAKLTEFQNFSKMVTELATPLNVDEGFKCTVTKNSRIVEPLGAGDEDSVR
jgi:hypothetical protein